VEFRPSNSPNAHPPAAQAAVPTSLLSGFPWDTRSPFPQRKKCWAPRGQRKRARARPRHLRGAAPEEGSGGPLGLPEHTPSLGTPRQAARYGTARSGGPDLRTCEARELQARAAPPHLSGSRSPSASRCRRRRRRCRPGHDELRTPPPCPPRRELHCGGEGMGRGRRGGRGRERGGPAEGRGPRKRGIREGGVGEGEKSPVTGGPGSEGRRQARRPASGDA
jgi:hypothetical protein